MIGWQTGFMFTRLSQFYDYNELEAQYADLAEDAGITDKAANNGETRGSWFEPGQALATVARTGKKQ